MKYRYWRHITIAVIIKAILLCTLWLTFFRHEPRLSNQDADNHIFYNK